MPSTAVAVAVKAPTIWLRPKVITEPMEFITMEGIPTE